MIAQRNEERVRHRRMAEQEKARRDADQQAARKAFFDAQRQARMNKQKALEAERGDMGVFGQEIPTSKPVEPKKAEQPERIQRVEQKPNYHY